VIRSSGTNSALIANYVQSLYLKKMQTTSAPENIDPNAPLLIFDSGIGGLSVLKAIRTVCPNAPIVYAADYAAMPYGNKNEAEIAARVPALLRRLVERYQPRLVTIACNTACTIALSHIRAALDVPVVGTVPAVKPAALATRTGVFGLLGTAATIRQPYVDHLVAEFAADKLLLRHAAPELVLAAEAKIRGETIDSTTFKNALQGLTHQFRGDAMDVVILGCTHFPLLIDELVTATAFEMQFIDGSNGIARRIVHLTSGQLWPTVPPPSIFVTTGPFEAMAPYERVLRQFGFEEFAIL
jgi:glutamate racemase